MKEWTNVELEQEQHYRLMPNPECPVHLPCDHGHRGPLHADLCYLCDYPISVVPIASTLSTDGPAEPVSASASSLGRL
jgi:hypothetical protein